MGPIRVTPSTVPTQFNHVGKDLTTGKKYNHTRMRQIFKSIWRQFKDDNPEGLHQAADKSASSPSWADQDDLQQLLPWVDRYQPEPFSIDVDQQWGRFQQQIQPLEAQPGIRRLNWRWAGAAAALVAGVALVFFWRSGAGTANGTWQIIASGPNQIKTVELADGTQIRLGKNAKLAVKPSFQAGKLREVRLQGEAFFAVKANPQRPFVIHTSISKVTVLGTRFNLRANPQEAFTEVEVEEGLVELADNQSGRKVALPKGTLGTHQAAGIPNAQPAQNLLAQSWSTGRMQCNGTPLHKIQAILERHTALRIVLANPKLGNTLITGTVYLNNPEASLAAVGLSAGLTIAKQADGSILVKQ